MATAAPASRQRHTDLQPLEIHHRSFDRDVMSQSSVPGSGQSFVTLPSPHVLAAREYYRNHAVPGGIYDVTHLRPRRHSAIVSAGGLTTQLCNISISSSASQLPKIPERVEMDAETIANHSAESRPLGLKQNDLVKVGKIATRQKTSNSSPPTRVLDPIPFEYAHDRLRTWGHTYLGNIATADAFVNGVHLRRPSLALLKEGNSQEVSGSSQNITIRARVLPKDKERKSFLIQKQFDIEDLRASIPPVRKHISARDPMNLMIPRRSNRIRQSISGSTLQVPSYDQHPASTGRSLRRGMVDGSGAVPIHIEYALHYLPVLAALMLSGHIRKGDTIDLPLPYPEAWRDVIVYIYTGEGLLTVAVNENIMFLAGRTD